MKAEKAAGADKGDILSQFKYSKDFEILCKIADKPENFRPIA